MYTYDEWGNSVLHIMTGLEGLKLMESWGIKGMNREEYDKHIKSYYRIKEEESKELNKMLEKLDFLFKKKGL